jgi:hypothetical protein
LHYKKSCPLQLFVATHDGQNILLFFLKSMKPEVMGASFWTKLGNRNPPVDNQNDPNKHFLP